MKYFLMALHFLTRIKIGKNHLFKEYAPGDFGRSTFFFPLVGLIIGGLLFGVAYLAGQVWTKLTAAVFLVAAEVLVTGGLHLDGLADTCDGMLSGKSRERVLEIMKDSRIGTMGVLGLLLVLALKTVLYYEIEPEILYRVVLILPVLGRWFMLWALTFYSPAKSSGLGTMFVQGQSKAVFWWASLYAGAIILLVLPLKLALAALLPSLCCLVIIVNVMNNALGGLTGDTYGAINEITEVVSLFWLTLALEIF